jgi:transcriptional regulator with XRE-family HTH domain
MSTMTSNQDALNYVSQNLRRILKEKGWTQTRLAQETGDQLSTINSIFHAKALPNIALMKRISEATGVNIDQFVLPPPTPPIPKIPSNLQNISENLSHSA